MYVWHFVYKIFSWIYFIKFPDVSLKYYSDLYSYRNNQDDVSGRKGYNGTWWKIKYDLRSIGSFSTSSFPCSSIIHILNRDLSWSCIPLLMAYFTEKNHNIWDRGKARGRLLLAKIVGCYIPCSINLYVCISYIIVETIFQLRLCLSV